MMLFLSPNLKTLMKNQMKNDKTINLKASYILILSENLKKNVKNPKFLPTFTDDQVLFYGTKHFYFTLRYFITLYERLKLIKYATKVK